MKIGYVSTYLPQQCGIATYTDYLIRGIRKVDPALEVKIIAEQGASSVKMDKFEVIPCWSRDENYVEPIISNIEAVDVAHIQHEYSIYQFDDRLPSLLQRLGASTKKIITIHCVRPAQFSVRGSVEENFAARIARLADAVIVHLPAQEAILTRLAVPSEKTHVIPHGTELSDEDKGISRKRLGLPLNAKILLMFGFIKRHKNVHIVLEALAQIREQVKGVHFFIAGGLAPNPSRKDRDYAEFLQKTIDELDLQRNVIYPKRFFPNEDVPYLLRASDIVLFPYCEEDRSASGSFHLAIGAKRPTIASRIPKFEELRNVCDDLLVLPFNSSGIARIAIRLFEDHEFRQYVVNRIEQYRNLTSWQAVARQHVHLYRKK